MSKVVVDDRDTRRISYTVGNGDWEVITVEGRTIHSTWEYGSRATFRFRGISIAVIGTIPRGWGETPVEFRLDGGEVHTESRESDPRRTTFDELWYQASSLSPGDHTLVITYRGADMDFQLDRFEYEEVPVATTPRTPITSPTNDSPPSTPPALGPTADPSTTSPSLASLISNDDSSSRTTDSRDSSSTRSGNGTDSSGSNRDFTVTATQFIRPSGTDQSSPSSGSSDSSDSSGSPDDDSVTGAGDSSTSIPIGAVIGAVIGAIILTVLVFLCVMLYRRRRRRLRSERQEGEGSHGGGGSSTSTSQSLTPFEVLSQSPHDVIPITEKRAPTFAHTSVPSDPPPPFDAAYLGRSNEEGFLPHVSSASDSGSIQSANPVTHSDSTHSLLAQASPFTSEQSYKNSSTSGSATFVTSPQSFLSAPSPTLAASTIGPEQDSGPAFYPDGRRRYLASGGSFSLFSPTLAAESTLGGSRVGDEPLPSPFLPPPAYRSGPTGDEGQRS